MELSFTGETDIIKAINNLLANSSNLLDIGCGMGHTIQSLRCPIKIGIDAHRPYLENRLPSANFIPLNIDASELKDFFLTGSFDCVTSIDVIEHFDKEAGLNILEQAERIARQRVIVFTPRGFFKQDNFDAFNLGGESFQQHRSGWEIEDFTKLGYNVKIFNQFHNENNIAFTRTYGQGAPPIDALLAWKDCLKNR